MAMQSRGVGIIEAARSITARTGVVPSVPMISYEEIRAPSQCAGR